MGGKLRQDMVRVGNESETREGKINADVRAKLIWPIVFTSNWVYNEHTKIQSCKYKERTIEFLLFDALDSELVSLKSPALFSCIKILGTRELGRWPRLGLFFGTFAPFFTEKEVFLAPLPSNDVILAAIWFNVIRSLGESITDLLSFSNWSAYIKSRYRFS